MGADEVKRLDEVAYEGTSQWFQGSTK